MICFDLVCTQGHRFEGWFRSGQGFEEQAAVGSLSCPVCGDSGVRKGVMAPAVARRRRGRDLPKAGDGGAEGAGSGAVARSPEAPEPGGPAPAERDAPERRVLADAAADRPGLGEALRMLRRVHDYVEKNFDNVGERFPEEARRMHHGESERRAIYGQATAEEAEALKEEGIPVRGLPALPKLDG